jgi:hypothetical protein
MAKTFSFPHPSLSLLSAQLSRAAHAKPTSAEAGPRRFPPLAAAAKWGPAVIPDLRPHPSGTLSPRRACRIPALLAVGPRTEAGLRLL